MKNNASPVLRIFDDKPTPAQPCRKGIVLAGGSGTRLYPVTQVISKQLLPIYDKPMVYYPLSTLMLAGIREVLLISTPQDIGGFERLLGDGSKLGISIQYKVQPKPEGLSQAFILGREFIGNDSVALVLGDNIFYGHGFHDMLTRVAARTEGATVFAYVVNDPERFGVVELDSQCRAISLEEKPKQPKSPYAVTGLYFCDNQVVDFAANQQPSARGELEITDMLQQYMERKQLHVELFGRGFAWLDTGTHASMIQAANFVETIETRQGLKIACLEEIAYLKGYITADEVAAIGRGMKNGYGEYLLKLLDRPWGVDRQPNQTGVTPSADGSAAATGSRKLA